MLRLNGFSSESSPLTSIESSKAAGKPGCRTSRRTLTPRIGAVQDVFSVYPKAVSVLQGAIRAANLDKGIRGTDFQSKKEQMLILCYLIENFPGLDAEQTRALGDAVIDKQKTLALLKSFAGRGEPGSSMAWRGVPSQGEEIWRNANSHAASMSDSRFLSFIKTIPEGDFLHNAAVECEKTTYECLTTHLNSMLHGISQQILSIQKEECDRHVRREVKNEEEKELTVSRAAFTQKVEDLSKGRSGSCVVHSLWGDLEPNIV